ncbi:hypothetical protein ACFQ1S_03965 [Kibdelosporangium lantanae]|uniref:Uncharacterized protein n=1 Tax=Kibdelosporangium lantanae TaxID=1497396 RepID=A0ABW3M2F0_9PSEU
MPAEVSGDRPGLVKFDEALRAGARPVIEVCDGAADESWFGAGLALVGWAEEAWLDPPRPDVDTDGG